tara:strand:+ start:510 stop:686 length:177 start_codon:yes stop_codon:yes gene_type:complete
MGEIVEDRGYYIKIKNYCKKDGTLVSSHYRKIKYRVLVKKITLVKNEYNDPNQLTFGF